jgi:hypothetical protein
MPDYRLFGGLLRSEVVLSELSPVFAGEPRWTLTRSREPLPGADGDALGREEVDTGVNVALYRRGERLQLAFDDTGVFEVSPDGRHITWAAPLNPDVDAVTKDILNRVFAVALHQEDVITLHGSAVALGDAAVAFLAPKFHGKSTTAAALVNTGGRFLSDDVVAVRGRAEPMVVPSVPVLQLWKDSAVRVGRAAVGDNQPAPKLRMAFEECERDVGSAVPLAAVYLLVPSRPDASAHVTRTRLSGVAAALALLGQAKIGALMGPSIRATLLGRMAELAERVPVYRLDVPRDFDRISELTSQLWRWHEGSHAQATAGATS